MAKQGKTVDGTVETVRGVRIEVMPDLRARLRGDNGRGAVLAVRDRYNLRGEYFPKILWQGNFRDAAGRETQIAAARALILAREV